VASLRTKELRARVRDAFPIPIEEALCNKYFDGVVETAVKKAISKFEKLVTTSVSGKSVSLPEAASIVRCLPSPLDGSRYTVFDFFEQTQRRSTSVAYNFTPDKVLTLSYEGTFYVEYVKATQFVTVEDLDDSYFEWTVEYSTALLMIREGFLGTRATLTALPLEFNYTTLLDTGKEDKTKLEEKLEEMYFGLFGGLSNS